VKDVVVTILQGSIVTQTVLGGLPNILHLQISYSVCVPKKWWKWWQ